ncbi:MAG: hypothetical protein KatS3mg065_0275 [Chloroflexota bacterium]|nr:MAG: hypothetical protein KatS3mg065_0275 [Chloroflexota bacterium]
MAADAASALALFVLVSVARFGADRWRTCLDPGRRSTRYPSPRAYAATWTTILWVLGLYRLRTRWSWRSDVRRRRRATILVAVVAFTALFWFKLPNVSRFFLLALFAGQGASPSPRASRCGRSSDGSGAAATTPASSSSWEPGREAERFANRIEARRELGLRVVGHVAVPAGAVASVAAAAVGAGEHDPSGQRLRPPRTVHRWPGSPAPPRP